MKKYIYIAIPLLLVGIGFFVTRISNTDNPNTVTDPTTNTPVISDNEESSASKKDKDETSQSVSSDNLFYDSAAQTTDVSRDKTSNASTNSDSDSDDGDSDDISPLADAALLLRASNVPLNWTSSDPWENEGTLGSAANAEVRDSVNVPNSHVVTPEYLPLFANGPGFKVDKPDYSPQYHGFVIPDNDALDIPNAGALTLIFDVSLIDPDDPTNKLAQKYPNVDLGSSEEGWILENINLGEYEGSTSLVNASNDGSGFAGIFSERRTTTDRFTVAIRWDRDADTSPDASLEIINDASGDSFLVADSADGDTSPFVIDSTGKVGVRTASPGTNNSVLEVTGSAYISDYTYTSMLRSTVESNSKIDMYDSSSGIAFILQNNTKDFRWAINSGSDLMNIDGSTGSVGIGDSTPDAQLDVSNTGTAGSVLQLTNSAGTCDHTPGAVTETVSCSSDQRLKTDISSAASVLSEINGLHVYDYTIIATGQKATGLIAQDVMQTNPEMVHMGEDGYYKVDSYNSWKLLKGIQELSSNIDNLQSTFTTALEQTNGNLEQTNQKLADLGLRVDDLSATLQSYADQLADHNQRIQSLEAKVQELEQAN